MKTIFSLGLKSVLVLVMSVLFSSCTIHFTRVPNPTLSEFPKEICGRYLFTSKKHDDSTYIHITPQTIIFSDNNILRGGGLSDTIKLAKGEKYYYLCQNDSMKGRLVWDVYPMKVVGNKMYLYALDVDYYKKPIKKYLTPVAGFDDLYEMDEKKLDLFCKKSLKNKNALKLNRVGE